MSNEMPVNLSNNFTYLVSANFRLKMYLRTFDRSDRCANANTRGIEHARVSPTRRGSLLMFIVSNIFVDISKKHMNTGKWST